MRDMIDPKSRPEVKESYEGYIVEGIAKVTITESSDLSHILNRVQDNQVTTLEDGKLWMIYQVDVIQEAGESYFESRFRVVVAPSLRYTTMDRNKLTLAEG